MKDRIFIIGFFCCIVLYLPVLILNTDMVTMIHDQFDGEVLAYILNAKYLFSDTIPEFLSGTSKLSLVPPSYGTLLFYILFRPEIAFFANYVFVSIVAYVGMYLFLEKLLGVKWIACVVAIIFTILPFYSVYGLSVMGQPLLFYAFLLLWNNEKVFRAYLLILIFVLFSSLVLVGFADICVMALISILGYKYGIRNFRFNLGILLLGLVYCALNVDLILQVLHLNNGFTSHKQDFYVMHIPFTKAFDDMFWNGMYHAVSNHKRIIIPAFLVLIIIGFKYRSLDADNKIRFMQFATLEVSSVSIALFYAFWHCYTITNYRNELGGLFVAFQLDRFYWLYPLIWFSILGYTLFFIDRLVNYKLIKVIILCGIIATNFAFLWGRSDLKVNYNVLINHNNKISTHSSIEKFYQPVMFQDISDYIGLPKEEYRLCSVGIYPSIALYNGFYCIDGYSNNYDIQYKYRFRQIISKELEKAGNKAKYFDNWGNRCYLFSSEVFNWNYIDKRRNKYVNKLELNSSALKAMNCRWLISSLKIVESNCLAFEKKFSSASSWYDVYLYRIL